jgi:hypothetical protein
MAFAIALLGFSNVQPAAAATQYFFDFNNGTVKPFIAISDPSGSPEAALLNYSNACYDSPGLNNGCATLLNSKGATFVAMLAQFKGSGVVRVDFVARDLGNCGRCAIIVYTGSGKPDGIGSFQKVGPVLDREWQHYKYVSLVSRISPVVAVGIMNLDFVAAKQMAGIDNLRVTMLDK